MSFSFLLRDKRHYERTKLTTIIHIISFHFNLIQKVNRIIFLTWNVISICNLICNIIFKTKDTLVCTLHLAPQSLFKTRSNNKKIVLLIQWPVWQIDFLFRKKICRDEGYLFKEKKNHLNLFYWQTAVGYRSKSGRWDYQNLKQNLKSSTLRSVNFHNFFLLFHWLECILWLIFFYRSNTCTA